MSAIDDAAKAAHDELVRQAHREMVRGAIRIGALTTYASLLAQTPEGVALDTVREEGQRLLAALGVDVPAALAAAEGSK